MMTSRQRLLQYLEKKQVASTREISLALKMTPANARHHLSILIDQGSVEIIGKLAGEGRGRPTILYRSVKPKNRNNLIDFARVLFREMLEGKNSHERDCQLRVLAHKIIKDQIPQARQQSKRLNETIQLLNQMNYQARWEAHQESPHIILENCPYLGISEDTAEICRMDEFILEKLLGKPVTLVSRLDSRKYGLQRCTFILKKD